MPGPGPWVISRPSGHLSRPSACRHKEDPAEADRFLNGSLQRTVYLNLGCTSEAQSRQDGSISWRLSLMSLRVFVPLVDTRGPPSESAHLLQLTFGESVLQEEHRAIYCPVQDEEELTGGAISPLRR